jgi:hypothetical protein
MKTVIVCKYSELCCTDCIAYLAQMLMIDTVSTALVCNKIIWEDQEY